RPADPAVAELTGREEARLRRNPEHRSSRATLERLANGYMIYGDSTEWDRFRIRNVALRGRIPGRAKIAAAKRSGPETRYLRMLQKDRRLRAEFLRLGS